MFQVLHPSTYGKQTEGAARVLKRQLNEYVRM